MALADLLYRCPRCGFDPMEGDGDEASCPACRTGFARGRGNRVLLERRPDGGTVETPVAALVGLIEASGGPLTRARRPDGSIGYSAEVDISWRVAEEPVHHKGALKGFSEIMGEPAAGILTVDEDAVTVRTEGKGESEWRFLEIRALQTSSSSLQLSLPDDQLVQFRFRGDSPRRWEDLMRHLLREAYRRAGKGNVVEFQPRIVTE
ncbi:MAG: hypothetical protein HKO53_13645 [Gemmatimonadetes bacterium]|nr:hypothetical protein [Gemmatimonadota bacterium]